MKRIFFIIITLNIIMSILVGCDSKGHEGEAKTPSGSEIQHGRNYEDVLEEFENSGFVNIKTEKIDDLVFGWITKDGAVESVSVDGDTEYSPDKWYPADVEIVIKYHTFPDDDYELEQNDDERNEMESGYSGETTLNGDLILTTENCQEFASILTLKADMDPLYGEFAEKYKGRVVEFDGCITYLTNHGDYKTRYDLLLSAGDYVNEDTQNAGPNFRFSNVGIYELGDGLVIADYIKIGGNVHVVAKVEGYNSNTGIFDLHLSSIDAR